MALLKTINNYSIKEIKERYIDTYELIDENHPKECCLDNLVPIIKDVVLDDALAIFDGKGFIVQNKEDKEPTADSVVDIYYIANLISNREQCEEVLEAMLEHSGLDKSLYLVDRYNTWYKSKLKGTDAGRCNPLRSLSCYNKLTLSEIKHFNSNNFWVNRDYPKDHMLFDSFKYTPVISKILLEDAISIFSGAYMLIDNGRNEHLLNDSKVDIYFIGDARAEGLYETAKKQNPEMKLHLVTLDVKKYEKTMGQILNDVLAE